jgi:hypothetical protein
MRSLFSVAASVVVMLVVVAAPAECGAVQRLGAPASLYGPPAVATSSAGRSVALLGCGLDCGVRSAEALGIRVARAGRPFGAPRFVSASATRPGRISPSDAQVVIGARGRAVLLWTSVDESRPAPPYSRDEDCCRRLWAAVRDESGRLRAATRLSAPGGPATSVVGAVRGRRAAVAWRDPAGIRVALGDARGHFARPATLAGEGQVLAVRIAPGNPRVVVLEASGAVAELWPTDRGTTRRLLGAFPPRTNVETVSSAAGHLLLIGRREEGLYPFGVLRVAHGRAGRRLRFTNVRVRWLYGLSAAAIAADGRALVLAVGRASRSTHESLVVVPVDRRGRPGRPRPVPRSSGWQPSYLAVAASSSGKALLASASYQLDRRYRPHRQRVFAWRVGLDGRGAHRTTVAPYRAYTRPTLTAGIDHAGRALVAWNDWHGVLAARVP